MEKSLSAGIAPETLSELQALGLSRGRPLVAVDCDEVMVEFASHLQRWLPSTGHEMRLTAYRLEGSIYPVRDPIPLDFDTCLALLDRFFREQTERQQQVEGAVEALTSLARDASVVILTNVPRSAREARARNVRALGMDFPLVVNTGGKGRALAWLARQVDAPMAFLDDSPQQLAHAARHAPDVRRIHFVGASAVRSLLPESPEAHDRAHSWVEAEAQVRRALGLTG